MPHNLTNEELIRVVLISPTASELERVLAERLSESIDDLKALQEREGCPNCGE